MGDGTGVVAARVAFICSLSVAMLCAAFPSPAALAAPSSRLLPAQAYQSPATGLLSPPAHVDTVPPVASLPSDATLGALDGHDDAATQTSASAWFFVGFFLSWIGIILGYVLRPSVDGARLVGKPPAYVRAYTGAYQIEGRSFQGIHAVYGCITSGALLLVVTLLYGALLAVFASHG